MTTNILPISTERSWMEHKKTVNKKRLIKLSILTLAAALAIYASFRLITYVLPFVFAFMFSGILKKPAEFLVSRLKFKRGIAAAICTIIFFLIILTILFFVVIALINQLTSLVSALPKLINEFSDPLSNLINSLNDLGEYFPNLSEKISQGVNQISDSLVSSLASIATNIAQYVVSTAISIPAAIVFMLITILATYFYTKDRKYFKDLLSKQLPDLWIERFYEDRKRITGTLGRWLKAQGKLLGITFVEMFAGLSIIGVRYSLLMAIIIALIDILPVLGTGTIMIPWILISFLSGKTTTGIMLLVLYAFETTVRQIIEPKIVGKGIGIHPLITLFSMYIGAHIFGVTGFLLGPIYIMIFKNVMIGILDGKKITEYISLRSRITGSGSNE